MTDLSCWLKDFGPSAISAKDTPDYLLEDEQAIEEAEINGFEVIYGTEYTLQLDLDSETDYTVFRQNLARLVKVGMFDISYVTKARWEEWRSKSGNRHVVLHLKTAHSVPLRIMFQLMLGSDRTRETLNWQRHLRGIQKPIRLFKPKWV